MKIQSLIFACAISVFGALIVVPAYASEVYKWVDANGEVHFGDKPTAQGAQQVVIQPTNGTTPPTTSELNTVNTTNTQTKPAQPPSQPSAPNTHVWCSNDQELCDTVVVADPYCRTAHCANAARVAGCNTPECREQRKGIMNGLRRPEVTPYQNPEVNGNRNINDPRLQTAHPRARVR